MSRPLSILFVTYEYPNKNGKFGGSGIATTYYELTQGLASLGHDIWVLSHSADKETVYKDHNVNVWRIPSDAVRRDSYERVRSRSRAVAKAISKILKQRSFDIIQFPEFNAEGYDFFRSRDKDRLLRKPKVVVRLHSSSKPYKKMHHLLTEDEERNFAMEKTMLQGCDLIISPCRATWRSLKSALGIKKSSLAYIPNAISSSLFVPDPARRRNRPFTFGYVGKLSPAKGVDKIIAAFAALEPAAGDSVELKLIGRSKSIAGKGNYYEWLIKDLPGHVRSRIVHIDYLPREELVGYYQHFDAFLFASRNENFPNTVMEAMACGLPVVASGVGGVPELLGKDNPSLQFDYEDTDALIHAMKRMYADQNLRTVAGAHNRKRIEAHYSTPHILKKVEKAYRELLSQP